MSALTSTSLCTAQIPKILPALISIPRNYAIRARFPLKGFRIQASSTEPADTQLAQEDVQESDNDQETSKTSSGLTSAKPALDKDLKKARNCFLFLINLVASFLMNFIEIYVILIFH